MSRRAEVYEQEYYEAPTPPRARDRATIVREREEEIDVIRRRDREPEFLREDYGRTDAGAIVIKERDLDEFTARPRERDRVREREREREIELVSRPRDRDRDPYIRPRPARDSETEIDIITRDRRERDRGPEFLREDYGRTDTGPLIMRERETATFRPRERELERETSRETEIDIIRRRGEGGGRREIDDDYDLGRGSRSHDHNRSRETEIDIITRREGRDRSPSRDRRTRETEIDIISRRDTRERSRSRDREREREREREIYISRNRERGLGRESEIDIISRSRRGSDVGRSREIRRESEIDIITKSRGRDSDRYARPRSRSRDTEIDIITRERDRDRHARPRSRSRETEIDIITRERERDRDRDRDRDRYTRPRPRSRSRDRHETEIDITTREGGRKRETEIDIIRTHDHDSDRGDDLREEVRKLPPLHQEIITHHRHIDHGIERVGAVERLAPPSPPSPPNPLRGAEEEIRITRRTASRNGRDRYEDEIVYERESSDHLSTRNNRLHHRHSFDDRHRYSRESEFETEAEYYSRRAADRAVIGEAYNGATRDWAIVDVPPGTERVRMDGVGGASQEITWQRYNGVRRSEFIPERDTFDELGGGQLGPHRPAESRMWTEITKDLVVREALEDMGYEFEETEFFFYVIQYLRYEDVLRLVELSQDIRRDRQERVREIQYEREFVPEPRRITAGPVEEERIYEREVIFEDRRGGPRYIR